MTSRPDRDRRAAVVGHSPVRVFAALLPLAFVLSGCDGAGGAADGSTAGLVDQFKTFVADFARQALAAWLL